MMTDLKPRVRVSSGRFENGAFSLPLSLTAQKRKFDVTSKLAFVILGLRAI